MSDGQAVVITLVVAFLVLALGGTMVVQQVRWRRKQQREEAEQVAEDFLKIERLRLQLNTERVLKEVDECLKQDYPQANRKERRAVKAGYLKRINSA